MKITKVDLNKNKDIIFVAIFKALGYDKEELGSATRKRLEEIYNDLYSELTSGVSTDGDVGDYVDESFTLK